MTARFTLIALLLVSFSLVLGGCCTGKTGTCGPVTVLECSMPECDAEDADLIATTYCAVDTLLARARENLAPTQKILTATFVDMNDMRQTYPFGRLSGELAAARLSHHGLAAVNMNIRADSVAIVQREGQFVLSRDIKELAAQHNAEAALVGMFTMTDTTVFVSQRLINIGDNTLIGAIDYEVPKGPKLRSLLTRTYGGSWADQSW